MKKVIVGTLLIVGLVLFVGCGNSGASKAVDTAIKNSNDRIDKLIESEKKDVEFLESTEIFPVEFNGWMISSDEAKEEIKKLKSSIKSYDKYKFSRDETFVIVYEDDNNYYVCLRKNADDDDVIVDGFKVGKENERVSRTMSDWRKIKELYENNSEPVLQEENIELNEDTMDITYF